LTGDERLDHFVLFGHTPNPCVRFDSHVRAGSPDK